MNITPWQMYWLTRLDDVSIFFFMLGLIALVAGILGCIINYDTKGVFIIFRNILIVGVSLLMLDALIPGTKEMAAIIVVPKIVNNQKVQEIPSKLLDLATAWLDELKPKEPK